jgi:hypothetical protein
LSRAQRRFLLAILWILLLCVATEVAARIFWRIRYRVPLTGRPQILESFYPELRPLRKSMRRTPERADVLILGGSVASNAWGNISTVLREELTRKLRRRVTVLNLAMPAHTTLDSYYKYRSLAEHRFAVVAIYHGINDVRTNNCPTALFRDDYSHYSWYRDLNSLFAHSEANLIVLPYTLEMLYNQIKTRLGYQPLVPTALPPKGWLDCGAEIKSARPFEVNLQRIIDLADSRDQRVLLMSFAFYLASDYSELAFQDMALPYTLHSAPLQAWGRPEHVAAAVGVHNEIIHKLAGKNNQTLFLDQASIIPHESLFFNDPCHLTARGCLLFGESMAESLVGVLE